MRKKNMYNEFNFCKSGAEKCKDKAKEKEKVKGIVGKMGVGGTGY